MLRKFASIKHPTEFGYSFDSEAWTSGAPIDTHFRMFQTFGDGLIQHSGDWAITSEYFADYLTSLAQAMLADEELCERTYYMLMRGPSKEEIAFAASVVFKPDDSLTRTYGDGSQFLAEKKQRYFSLEEKKITANREKEHDKRYQKLERGHDGSVESVYRILLPDYCKGLGFFQWAWHIREWAMATDGKYMGLVAEFLGWTKDRDEARAMAHAFECVRNVAESYRLRRAAESDIESYKRNVERHAAARIEAVA